MFAEFGLDVSTNEIARRAGVGVAILFRRFPTRDDLVAASFADKMRAHSEAIDEALAAPDPWQCAIRWGTPRPAASMTAAVL